MARDLAATGDEGPNNATVTVGRNGYGVVYVTIKTRHGSQQAFFRPEETLRLARAVLEEATDG